MGRKKDKKDKKGKTADSYPFVSVCTPTFNRKNDFREKKKFNA